MSLEFLHTFTGVGSRETPPEVLKTMHALGRWLARAGLSLRSGSARGADSAWEAGVLEAGGKLESFLPWEGFESRNGSSYIVPSQEQMQKAQELVATTHPNWKRLSESAITLHSRNVFQVLGLDMQSPSTLLLCWTPDACIGRSTRSARTGGTGTAIVLAETYGVPVINMADPQWQARLWAYWSLLVTSRHWEFAESRCKPERM